MKFTKFGKNTPAVIFVFPTSSPNIIFYSSSKPSPLGRPRWLMSTTRAPSSMSFWIVGSAARMRVSSVTTPSLTGTLKSTRTRTRLPFTLMSSTVFLFNAFISLLPFGIFFHTKLFYHTKQNTYDYYSSI